MTVVALWHSVAHKALCCIADTRLSRLTGSTTTDNGPKIFQVPVTLNVQLPDQLEYEVRARQSFGFAFSGSALAAVNTYSLAVACTQNLRGVQDSPPAVSVEEVARLFRSIADHYIRDMSSRLGTGELISQFFFDGFVFGFCPVVGDFKAFMTRAGFVDGAFLVDITERSVLPGNACVMGSGTDEFLRIAGDRQREGKNDSPIAILKEMLRIQTVRSVGGHVQIGVDDTNGFRILPVVSQVGDPEEWSTTFLGWDATAAGPIGGYGIGYRGFGFEGIE